MELAIWREYKDRGLMVLGVSNQPTSVLELFIANQGLTFPVLQNLAGSGTSIYSLYLLEGGESPYPRDFIIDQEGIIRFASTEYEPAPMITLIEELLSNGETVANQDETPALPIEYHLSSFPNPFNATTNILINLPRAANVNLRIFDLSGKAVRTLSSEVWLPGTHSLVWNGRNDIGNMVSSGIYFARLATPDHTSMIKMTLLK